MAYANYCAEVNNDESKPLQTFKSGNEEQSTLYHTLRERSLHIIAVASSSLTILLIISMIIHLRVEAIRIAQDLNVNHPLWCGNNSAKAKAIGCSWDIFANVWMPSACYDPYVTSISESETKYPFFWDANHTKQATMDELQTEAFVPEEKRRICHVAWAFHLSHCLHLWRLAANALEMKSDGKKVMVYEGAALIHHANHCNGIVRHFEELKNEDAWLQPGVGRCSGDMPLN